MLKRKKNKKGFTLIELMITVSIIAILSGVLLQVINPTALRRKTRDKQRVSDLKRIQAALELYFADNRQYPVTSGWVNVSTIGLSTYIQPIPSDPGTGNYHYYSNGNDYCLAVFMEVPSSGNGCTQSICAGVNGGDPIPSGCYSVVAP